MARYLRHPGDTGYLVWQTQGVEGTGPAVVLQTYPGTGGVIKWYANTAAFPPHRPGARRHFRVGFDAVWSDGAGGAWAVSDLGVVAETLYLGKTWHVLASSGEDSPC